MNLFGKKKEGPKVPDPVQTILNLQEQIDMLDKKSALNDARIAKVIESAKLKMKKGDKKGN